MIVHSLSGPSGTGKSTSAIAFAHEHQIEAIIDDGLLIIDGERKAGTSAKFEKNTITAVRRAIFYDEQHRREVQEAIEQNDVRSILIIGTSDKMTKKIASCLKLGVIDYFHHIEEIRTKKEIQIAQFIRGTQGKHVMPIPYKQVEQNFFKRLVQKGFDIFSKNREKLGEITIVQPDFHRQVIDISRTVYIELINYTVEQCKWVSKVDFIQFEMKHYNPTISVSLFIKGPVTYPVYDEMRGLQELIREQFIIHFEFEPVEIRVMIKGIQ